MILCFFCTFKLGLSDLICNPSQGELILRASVIQNFELTFLIIRLTFRVFPQMFKNA